MVAAIPLGIDVSSYQRNVDWRQVATSGVVWAASKATGGSEYVNPYFEQQWKGARDAGIYRCAYHYAFESSFQSFPGAGPEVEAQYFLDEIDRMGGLYEGDMVALDMEDGRGNLLDWTLRWLRYVENQVGFTPLFYSGQWFMGPHGLNDQAMERYPLWFSAYQSQWPETPAPWSFMTFWQFTSDGRVPGIDGVVDLNYFNGTLDRIPLLGKSGGQPQPTQPTQPSYVVGEGILTKMRERGAVPATNEEPMAWDSWREAFDNYGTRYVYVVSLNQVFVFPSA